MDKYIHISIYLYMFIYIIYYIYTYTYFYMNIYIIFVIYIKTYICVIYNFSNKILFTTRWVWSMYFHIHYGVRKCTSFHKAIVTITGGRAQCFPDHTSVKPILFLWDLSTLCAVDDLCSSLHPTSPGELRASKRLRYIWHLQFR